MPLIFQTKFRHDLSDWISLHSECNNRGDRASCVKIFNLNNEKAMSCKQIVERGIHPNVHYLLIFLTSLMWKKKFESLCCVWLFATPWTVQAPLSMEFSRQNYWSGLPFRSPGNFPNPGIEPMSPSLAGGFFTIWASWEAWFTQNIFLLVLPLMKLWVFA